MSSEEPASLTTTDRRESTRSESIRRESTKEIKMNREKQPFSIKSKEATFARHKNEDLLFVAPRQSVVEHILDRDRMYSIALPPNLSEPKIPISRSSVDQRNTSTVITPRLSSVNMIMNDKIVSDKIVSDKH